jgi:hypothetical protein
MKLVVQTLAIALSVFLGCALPATRIPDNNQGSRVAKHMKESAKLLKCNS